MTGTSTEKAAGLGNSIAPPRFLMFIALLAGGIAAYRLAWPSDGLLDGVALSFDVAAAIFLASLIPLLSDSSPEIIREHAIRNDANRVFILVFTSVLTLVAMAAIAGELKQARAGHILAIVTLVGTLLLVWLFANTIYALHYAHVYYARNEKTGEDAAGIEFPGTPSPDYGDFLYFSCTLGMTFQTSDSNIRSSIIRRIVLLHSFAAYIFSIGVIAFTINVLGGGAG